MKWIGQHIWDFISRFRNDVYFEAVPDGIIASGKNLGLDSNNKLVKESDTGITDLHGAGVDGSDNQILTDDGDGTVTSESNLTFASDVLSLTSASSNLPSIALKNSNTDANPSSFSFVKTARGSNSDSIGIISFISDDAGDNPTTFATINGSISSDGATDGDERGSFSVKVISTESGSSLETGIQLVGGSDGANRLVDVSLGTGTGSTTTLAGVATINGGVVRLGEGNGNDIYVKGFSTTSGNHGGSLYLEACQGNGTDKNGGALQLKAGASTGSGNPGDFFFMSSTTGSSGSSTNGSFQSAALTSEGNLTIAGDLTVSGGNITNAVTFDSGLTTSGDITLGSADPHLLSNGDMTFVLDNDNDSSSVHSFKFHNNTTHASGEIASLDELGNLQIDGGITTGSTSAMNSSGVLQVAAQTNITSVGTLTGLTVSGNASFTSDEFTITSASSLKPRLSIINTNTDQKQSVFSFTKSATGADDDIIGQILFEADNAADQSKSFAQIVSTILIAADGDEAGALFLGVTTSNDSASNIKNGIVLTGSNADNDVDIAIGSDATSITTITGFLNLGGHSINDIDIATEFVDSDEHIMTSAAINDKFATQTALANTTSVGALNSGSITSGFGTINNGSSAITTTGTVSGGELQVDDINLNNKTITLTGSTGDTCTIACDTNGVTTITTTDTASNDAHLNLVADGNISTSSNAVSVQTDDFTIYSDTSAHPTVLISNTTGDATGGELILHNKRTGSGGVNDDYCGNIHFQAPNHDGSDNYISYASILGRIVESQDTDEAGRLGISVATSNGLASTSVVGFNMYGHATEQTVNVDIGYGDRSDTTVNGNLTANKRKFTVTDDTAGRHDGDIVYFGGEAETIAAGQIVHYKSDGNWELADADDNTKSDGLLGVALGADASVNGVLLRGIVTLDHDAGAIGDPLYLTTTAGDASATAPSGNGNIVRNIGYKIYHASEKQIWFNPDSTFVEITA